MTFKISEQPGKERRWLIEMSESETAILSAHCNHALSVLGNLNTAQILLLQTLLIKAKTAEQVALSYNSTYKSLNPALYEFVQGLYTAKLGLKSDPIAWKRAMELFSKPPTTNT